MICSKQLKISSIYRSKPLCTRCRTPGNISLRLISDKLPNKDLVEQHIVVDRSGLINPQPIQPPTSTSTHQIKQTSLMKDLRGLIKLRGPITVAEYMQHCLSHPEFGYYKNVSQKAIFGTGGDFITAPEISQMFGEMIGIFCVSTWQRLGSPKKLKLVEIGPGKGTLMADLLRSTKIFKGFHDALSYGGVEMVETSLELQKVQKAKLESEVLGVSQIPVRWHETITSAIETDEPTEEVKEKEETPAIFICQELFDALPIHQFQKNKQGFFREVLVDLEGEAGLQFVVSKSITPAARVLLPDKLLGIGSDVQETKEEDSPVEVIEISPLGAAMVQDIVKHLKKNSGAFVAVDYGFGTENVPQEDLHKINFSKKNSLRGIKKHEYVSPLVEPGEIDLSVDVNFDYLRFVAAQEMKKSESLYQVLFQGPTTQKEFLLRLGIEYRLSNLLQGLAKDFQGDELKLKQLKVLREFKRLTGSESEADGGMGVSYKVLGIFAGIETNPESPAPGFE
eukprot:maker-scaffold_11-snap-gene-9.41-mRNA-1 protein AED:0.02 eAED:0.02 QI:38/1/1/1/1/1/4/179/507